MECEQFKSVVSLVDSLVRSAQSRRSAPVSSKSLTNFSIRGILDIENDITQTSTSSGKLNFFQTPELHRLHGYTHVTLKFPTFMSTMYKYDSNGPSNLKVS